MIEFVLQGTENIVGKEENILFNSIFSFSIMFSKRLFRPDHLNLGLYKTLWEKKKMLVPNVFQFGQVIKTWDCIKKKKNVGKRENTSIFTFFPKWVLW